MEESRRPSISRPLAIEAIWVDLEKYMKQVAAAAIFPTRRSSWSTAMHRLASHS